MLRRTKRTGWQFKRLNVRPSVNTRGPIGNRTWTLDWQNSWNESLTPPPQKHAFASTDGFGNGDLIMDTICGVTSTLAGLKLNGQFIGVQSSHPPLVVYTRTKFFFFYLPKTFWDFYLHLNTMEVNAFLFFSHWAAHSIQPQQHLSPDTMSWLLSLTHILHWDQLSLKLHA